MMHLGKMHALFCALVVLFFISVSSVQASGNRSEQLLRITERVEQAHERLAERLSATCERLKQRGVPAKPHFCVIEDGPIEDDEDEQEEEETDEEDEQEEHEEEEEDQEEEENEEGGDSEPVGARVVISEVYYDVHPDFGTESANEWVELYNVGDAPADLTGWKLVDAVSSDTFGVAVLPAGGFALVTNNASTLDFWDIPESTVIILLGSPIGNGLGNTGDALYLRNAADEEIDALSWGANTDVFDPSAPDPTEGWSIARCPAHVDTDTAADWVAKETPTPGFISPACGGEDGEEETDAEQEEGDQEEEELEEENEDTDEHGGDGSNGDTGDDDTTSGALVISEVYYFVALDRGSDPANEWVELYNGTNVAIDLSGWVIADANSSDTLPSGTVIEPGQYLVVVGSSTTAGFWDIPETALVVNVGSFLGNGLANGGDVVYLRTNENELIDAVSWGTNTDAFTPSVPVITAGNRGRSMARVDVGVDTDTADDWEQVAIPSPGA